MHVVFRHDRDVVSKNPGGGVDPTRVARWARRQGVLSFGYLFFARAKKSSSLPERGAKAFALEPLILAACFIMGRPSKSLKAELSLLLRRSEPPFFARAKKRGPKKARPDASRCGCAASVPCAPRGTGGRRTTRFTQTRAPLRPLSRCGARLALRQGSQKQKATAKAKAPSPTSYAQGRGKAGIPRDSTCCAFITPSIAEEYP